MVNPTTEKASAFHNEPVSEEAGIGTAASGPDRLVVGVLIGVGAAAAGALVALVARTGRHRRAAAVRASAGVPRRRGDRRAGPAGPPRPAAAARRGHGAPRRVRGDRLGGRRLEPVGLGAVVVRRRRRRGSTSPASCSWRCLSRPIPTGRLRLARPAACSRESAPPSPSSRCWPRRCCTPGSGWRSTPRSTRSPLRRRCRLGDAGLSLVGVVPGLVVVGVVVLFRRARSVHRRRAARAAVGDARRRRAGPDAASRRRRRTASSRTPSGARCSSASSAPFRSCCSAGLVRYRLLDVDLYVVRTLGRGVLVVLVVLRRVRRSPRSPSAARLRRGRRRPDRARGADRRAAAAAARTLADRWLTGGRVARRGRCSTSSSAALRGPGDDLAERICRMVAEGLDVAWCRVVVHGEVRGRRRTAVTRCRRRRPLRVGTRTSARSSAAPGAAAGARPELARLESLATPAALALRERELTRELAERVDELTASRARLVQVEQPVRRSGGAGPARRRAAAARRTARAAGVIRACLGGRPVDGRRGARDRARAGRAVPARPARRSSPACTRRCSATRG